MILLSINLSAHEAIPPAEYDHSVSRHVSGRVLTLYLSTSNEIIGGYDSRDGNFRPSGMSSSEYNFIDLHESRLFLTPLHSHEPLMYLRYNVLGLLFSGYSEALGQYSIREVDGRIFMSEQDITSFLRLNMQVTPHSFMHLSLSHGSSNSTTTDSSEGSNPEEEQEEDGGDSRRYPNDRFVLTFSDEDRITRIYDNWLGDFIADEYCPPNMLYSHATGNCYTVPTYTDGGAVQYFEYAEGDDGFELVGGVLVGLGNFRVEIAEDILTVIVVGEENSYEDLHTIRINTRDHTATIVEDALERPLPLEDFIIPQLRFPVAPESGAARTMATF